MGEGNGHGGTPPGLEGAHELRIFYHQARCILAMVHPQDYDLCLAMLGRARVSLDRKFAPITPPGAIVTPAVNDIEAALARRGTHEPT